MREPTSGKKQDGNGTKRKGHYSEGTNRKGRVGTHYPTTFYTGRALYTKSPQEKGARKSGEGEKAAKTNPKKRARALTETKRANTKK